MIVLLFCNHHLIPLLTSLTNYWSLNNYSAGFTPTESSVSVTLLHVSYCLSYKPQNDLNIC